MSDIFSMLDGHGGEIGTARAPKGEAALNESMVERVAKAFLDAPLDNDKFEPDTVRQMLESYYASQIDYEVSESAKKHVAEIGRIVARAAIEAMREPTDEMKHCDEEVHWDYSCHVCGGLMDGWHKMIDAALSGK